MELHLKPWEPEETVGTLWHLLVGGRQAVPVATSEAAVSLESMRGRMGVMLRGLGGGHGFEIIGVAPRLGRHRRRFWQRVGHVEEMRLEPVVRPGALAVPPVISLFAQADLNVFVYLWLAAWAALFEPPARLAETPLARDLQRLRLMEQTVRRILALAPGLGAPYREAARLLLPLREVAAKTLDEKAMEHLVRWHLGAPAPLGQRATALRHLAEQPEAEWSLYSGEGAYMPFAPVALWPDWEDIPPSAVRKGGDDSSTPGSPEGKTERRRARREASDQAKQRDSLILHRFETIKTWAEMLNLNRKVEDEDEHQAQKAAGDHEHLGLADVDQRPASRLAFDLDLSPQDIAREALSEGLRYPEWDYKTAALLAAQVRVLEHVSKSDSLPDPPPQSAAQKRRIARVRRQFEALMPRSSLRGGEIEGSELDADQAVRFVCDAKAGQAGDERMFRRLVGRERDLSVATLIDVSRSTESVVDERPVIEIARESLLALGHGLQATGDRHAIYSFSSLRRERVFLNRVKDFNQPMDGAVERQIAALQPGHYTRLGAAIRHVSARLRVAGGVRKLLLIITDGKPNDADYYEGRYGIEDSRHAVQEARMMGQAVFAITIDERAQSYVPHIFGSNGFAIVAHPAGLVEALPAIYRHLVT